MSGFAKIIGAGQDQVLVKRGEEPNGDQTVVFYTHVDQVGVRNYATTFKANDTAPADADLFFDAVDENLAYERQTLIRAKWAVNEDATSETE